MFLNFNRFASDASDFLFKNLKIFPFQKSLIKKIFRTLIYKLRSLKQFFYLIHQKARLVVVSLSTPCIIAVIYVLTKNYLSNRLLMATKSIIRMYNSLNVIFSLLKLDLQLNVSGF